MTARRRAVLITGGKGSLAQACAAAFAGAGYNVLAPGRDELDVTDAAHVHAYFSKLDRLSLLINCAGCVKDELAARMPPEWWDEVLKTNLHGARNCSEAAYPLLRAAEDGHVINIGSYSGRFGAAGQSNYAAAKAALGGLTEAYARQWGPDGIRVNIVLPGFLETRMTRGLPQGVRKAALEAHVLGRFNTAEDAARFLVCLDSLRHVSGQCFQIDSRVPRRY